jgi:hypothetical protein
MQQFRREPSLLASAKYRMLDCVPFGIEIKFLVPQVWNLYPLLLTQWIGIRDQGNDFLAEQRIGIEQTGVADGIVFHAEAYIALAGFYHSSDVIAAPLAETQIDIGIVSSKFPRFIFSLIPSLFERHISIGCADLIWDITLDEISALCLFLGRGPFFA